MRIRTPLAIVLAFTFWTATRIHGQITSNPIPGRIEKRGLAVEIRDVVRLPHTRGFVLPIRTCRRLDGRGSATCENFPTAAASPTIPAAFCT